MKPTLALSLLTVATFHQLALCQGQPAVPTLPALETDIYWWKTLLNSDQLKNYLTGPAASPTVAATEATPTIEPSYFTPTTGGPPAVTKNGAYSTSAIESDITISASAAASASGDLSSASATLVSEASTVTPSAVAWSSSSTDFASASATGGTLKPSGSAVPPSTSGNALPTSSSSHIIADSGRVIFSIIVAAIFGSIF